MSFWISVGPFIIYEYCEKGTLKDYLVNNKTNLTIELQENLFRFGLDIAKGMEYLAGKGVNINSFFKYSFIGNSLKIVSWYICWCIFYNLGIVYN